MRRLARCVLLPIALGAVLAPSHSAARAQVLSTRDLEEAAGISAAGATNDSGPAGIIPVTRGLNASLASTSQHDSSNGWSSVLVPDVAYRIDRYFTVDASVPAYMYINIYADVGAKTKPAYAYQPEEGVFGDTVVAFHGEAAPLSVDYEGTISMGLPSGNTGYGLGAGQVTYNLNNHFEKSFGRLTPDLELGYGDTSSLVDQRVRKSYVAVGPLAHFQAGASLALPWSWNFEADSYEELPLSKNLVYSTTGKGKKKKTTSTNEGPAEDNGFITALDVPLSPHLTLSGLYSRSLRDHDDVAGFSLTFLLKPPPRLPRLAE